MSQSESLRMAVEVQDRFTGPLGALKKQMENLSREGGVHTDTLTKGFGRLTSEAQATEKAISSGLKPALGVVGITGLSAAAAITGIASAMRSFAAGAASLGALSRETGQTAENLRNFGAVAGKFGIEQDAVAAGTKNFAGQMREFGRGIGETFQWLNRQGRDAAGGRHFQDFAADLRATTDSGEQLRKVLREMENIKDPVERGMFAEKFFGNTDFGRLGDKHFGPILEMWKKTAQKLGPLDPAAVKSAEDFERTMSELRTSMQKLGTTIGQEVLPYASQFTTWLSDIVGGQRNDAIKAIRQGIGEIRREIDGIDWKGAGERAKEFLTGTITFAGDLVKALKAAGLLLGALKDLKDGNVSEALKKLGAADSATDLGMGQGRAPGAIQDSMRADTGPLVMRRTELERQLRVIEENIARRESQPDPMGEGRVVDTEGRARRDRLIDETRKLSDEIRRLREDPPKHPAGEATAQPSALEGGTGMGGLIHRASLGGMAGAAAAGRYLGGGNGIVVPGVPGYGGGAGGRAMGGGEAAPDSGPRAAGRALRPDGRDRLFGGDPGAQGGESRAPRGGGPGLDSGPRAAGRALRPRGGDRRFTEAPGGRGGAGRAPEGPAPDRGEAREAFRNYLRRNVPGYDGGDTVPVGPDGRIPGLGYRPGSGESGAARSGRALRGEGETSGAGANPGDYKEVLDYIAKQEGTSGRSGDGYNTSLSYGAYLPGGKEQNLTGKTLDEIDGLQSHMLRNPANRFNSSAIGRYQIVRTTLRSLRRKLGLRGDEQFDEAMQDRLGAELARARGANARGLGQEWESLKGAKGEHAAELMRRVRPGASTMPSERPASGARRPEVLADPNDERRQTPSFADFLRERSQTKGFGTREDREQPVNPETGASIDSIREQMKRSADSAAGRSIWGGEDNEGLYRSRAAERAPLAREFLPDAKLTREQILRLGPDGANGAGFSADYKARQESEDRRRQGMRLGPAGRSALMGAVGAGAVGATQNTDRNLIDLRVHNPGPNTHVTTDTKGPLFREVQQTRGRQMQPAGEDV